MILKEKHGSKKAEQSLNWELRSKIRRCFYDINNRLGHEFHSKKSSKKFIFEIDFFSTGKDYEFEIP